MGKGKAILIGGAIITGIVIASRHASAASPDTAGKRYTAPLQLTKNFNLSEFLDQHPGLASYPVSQAQLDNVTRLANVLQKVRDKYGPIRINSGARPTDWKDEQGRSLKEILRSEGYTPSDDSDHDYFGAADIYPTTQPDNLAALARDLANDPDVRQVIISYKKGTTRPLDPEYIHVAVVMPGRPRIQGKTKDGYTRYAFVEIDGKATGSFNYAA